MGSIQLNLLIVGFIITTTQPLQYPTTFFYTLPKQAMKRHQETRQRKKRKKKCLPALQVHFNQRTHLANKKNKASTQVIWLKMCKLWTTSKDRVFSYEEGRHIDMLNKMHLILADLILNYWNTSNSNSLSILILSSHLTLFSLLLMHIINPTNTCTNSLENAIKNINLQKNNSLSNRTLSCCLP